MIFNKCILFVALTVTTVTALTHGHVARSSSHYEVARNVIDGLSKKDVLVPEPAIRRRASNSQRCKARPKAAASSSSSSSSSSTSSSAHHNATPTKADVPPPPSSTTQTSSKAADTPKPSADKPTSISPVGGGLSFGGGKATFYTQNGVQGACGAANSDSAMICALFTSVFDGGKHCGKQVKITNTSNGKTVVVTAADECPTCNGPEYVDLSTGAFSALGGTQSEGMFPIAYEIL